MARLPEPGADAGQWAHLLNEFLMVAHNPDGTIRTATKPAANGTVVATATKPAATTSTSALATTGTVGINDLNTLNSPSKYWALSNDGTNLIWSPNLIIDVKDFGAIGDGIADDTAAIQAAINAASNGGGISFPRGTYMVSGLVLHTSGVELNGGSRLGVRIKRIPGSTGPLVDISGTSSVNGHIFFCGIFNMTLDGNSMPSTLLRSYYCDRCIYRDVALANCPGLATDLVEVWDTRFYNCSWDSCGSSADPAMLLRNSTPSGTFGFSANNTNQIHFLGCRWERFRNGAVRLDGGVNGSQTLLNGVFFVSCKMETPFASGSPFQIMTGTTIVYVTQLYIAVTSSADGYNVPIEAIQDYGTHIFMSEVYVQWGPDTGLANCVAHIYRGSPHMYAFISSYFPTEDPITGFFVIESAASNVQTSMFITNRGFPKVVGTYTSALQGGPTLGYLFPVDNTGTFRIGSSVTGNDLIKVDNNTTRPAFEVANAVDTVGFSDNYVTERWRVIGSNGAARFASGKFQIEGTKGYAAINTVPFTGIAMLIKAAVDGDRGLAIVRPSSTATNRLMEFQDETYNIQGLSIDSNGRPVAVGTPPHVTPGAQVTYANPGLQVRDIAGNISAAVRPSPTSPGTIAIITFSRVYAATPLSITLSDNSAVAANLYISARSVTGFTVSTRNALQGGAILNFDYTVVA